MAVIESARNGKIVHVLVEDCGHLRLLNRGNTTLGVEDKDGNVLLPSKTIDGSRASVSTGGTNNRQVMSIWGVSFVRVWR